jgi:hypothetical protein
MVAGNGCSLVFGKIAGQNSNVMEIIKLEWQGSGVLE